MEKKVPDLNHSEAEAILHEKGLGSYEPLQPFVAKRELDRALWYEGQLIVMYAEGEAVGNSCCVFEGNCPEGFGPPPHIHLYEHEFFYVTEGHLKVWVEGVEFDVPKDSVAFLPCGRTHWFVSVAPITRIFSFTVSAGHGVTRGSADMAIFKAFGMPAEALTAPPPPDPDKRPDPMEVMQLAEENGLAFPRIELEGWMRAFGAKAAGAAGPAAD
jgi:mannose-6-phosphate isomerase-like protein (cupin superfamily)